MTYSHVDVASVWEGEGNLNADPVIWKEAKTIPAGAECLAEWLDDTDTSNEQPRRFYKLAVIFVIPPTP